MKKFEVIEDNAGGLLLAVFDLQGKVEYLHNGYEFVIGQLSADLKELWLGAEPTNDWDGNVYNPQQVYEELTAYKDGWEIIADNDGLYVDRMGKNGKKEFNAE